MTHMASSQVEIPSSAPFGCVLRDHNRRDRCNREKNVRAAFEKNLKELVHNCISVHPDSSSAAAEENSNLENQSDSVSSWVSVEQNKKSRIIDKTEINNINKREVNSISSRQSRILDRWRHAREIVSEKIESHRTKEGDSSGSQNIGASSLVQMWEARLHRSNSSKKYTSGFEEQSKTHETGDSGDERLETQTIHDESLTDWDSRSDRTAKSEPPTLSQSRSCDAGESERVKVADIIKRLTSDDNNDYYEQHSFSAGNSPSRRLSSGSDHAEPRGFLTQLISSPKIRGRQAFNDLIVQMERDRKQEIRLLGQSQAVSKFAQRGRIQSMLRLRFLQRGMGGNQDQLRVKPQSSPQLSRLKQASGIVHLRERFNGAVDQGTACRSTSGTVTPKSPDRETTNVPDATIVETPTVDIQPSRQVSLLEQHDTTPKPDLMPIMIQVSNNNISQVATQTSDVSWKDKSLSFGGEEEEEEEAEEIEDHEHQDFLDSNYDWFSEISRPRSYWEDRRQEWYSEMLNTNSANEEICRLLERRTVSSFLSSDFRDRMDELMTCRAQRQVDRTCNQQHEGDEESENGYAGGVQIHQQDCRGRDEPEEEQALGGGKDEQIREEEQEVGCSRGSIELEELVPQVYDEETPTSNRYLETADYFSQSSPSLQMQSPSPFRTWSYQSHEISDDSDRAPSVSSQQRLSDNQPFSSSSINHPSLEMELICDLRGHMMQMQREMLDLRRSILSCTEMQMQLQRTMKRDINIAQREEESSLGKVLKNRRCCICYEMPVDSLLYRCGHMCTCLKCAHELQWSSGKCPMCRASIVDVVRVFLEL